MSRYLRVVIALGAGALLAPLWSFAQVEDGQSMFALGDRVLPTGGPRLRTFLASADLEPVRSPERVESLPAENLLSSKDRSVVPMATNLPGRFRVLPEPMAVPPAIAAELSRLLLSPGSYLDAYLMCVFEPGIVFRFWRGKSAVDVLVCFHCRDLAFQLVGSPVALAPKLPFEPIRADLMRLSRSARPDDERLKDLR